MKQLAFVLLLAAAVGCGVRTGTADTSSALVESPPEVQAMNVNPSDRPPWDFLGWYNVPLPEGESRINGYWAEREDVPPLEDEEFHAVRADVVAALAKHGKNAEERYVEPKDRGPEYGQYDFAVGDEYSDQTLFIDLNLSERLPERLATAVPDVQRVMRRQPLWRTLLQGKSDADDEEETIVIYPDLVRIQQLKAGRSLREAVVENARIRLEHFRRRERHRARRNSELTEAVVKAFSRMDESGDEVVLVSWFGTVSGEGDWGFEGAPGTDVCFLLRNPVPEDFDSILQCALEPSPQWASADGSVMERIPKGGAGKLRQLVRFVDFKRVRSRLSFQLRGKRYRFVRPAESVNSARSGVID